MFSVKTDKDTVIDGVEVGAGLFYPVEQIVSVTQGRLQRPDDNGAYKDLCVDIGESVFWIPQDANAADNVGAPFLGWNNHVPNGQFVDNKINLDLVSAKGPKPGDHFAMWRASTRPFEFHMSTCDGIDEKDRLPLAWNHDHRAMAFTGEPGRWDIVFKVSGTLVEGNKEISTPLHVVFETVAK